MLRRTTTPSSHRDRKFARIAATAVTAIVGLVAVSLSTSLTSEAATKSTTRATTSKKKVTTTTKKRVVRTTTTKRRTVAKPTVATTTTTTPLPTVATAAPTEATTSTSTTTTTAAPAFDFDILVPTPAQSVAAGSSASFVVIVSTKAPATPRAVTFIATGIPEGAQATLSPNPTTSGAEFRVNVGANVAVGTYTIRLIGSAANVSKTTNVFINVTAATSATTSTTTTTTSTTLPGPTTSTIVVGAGAPTFAVVVSTDNNRLRTGNTISYFIRIIYANGFSTPASLQVNGLPTGVSGGFSPMSTAGTATLFVSSTVAIVPGTYTFNVTAIAGSYQQFVPVSLIIE